MQVLSVSAYASYMAIHSFIFSKCKSSSADGMSKFANHLSMYYGGMFMATV